MKAIEVPIPESLDEQKKIVQKFQKLESKIKKAQDVIDGIAERKEEVIKMYLMNEEPETLSMAAEPSGVYKKS